MKFYIVQHMGVYEGISEHYKLELIVKRLLFTSYIVVIIKHRTINARISIVDSKIELKKEKKKNDMDKHESFSVNRSNRSSKTVVVR